MRLNHRILLIIFVHRLSRRCTIPRSLPQRTPRTPAPAQYLCSYRKIPQRLLEYLPYCETNFAIRYEIPSLDNVAERIVPGNAALLFRYDAYLHLTGYINKQIIRNWSALTPINLMISLNLVLKCGFCRH